MLICYPVMVLMTTRNVRHMKNMAGSMTRELKIMVTLSVRLYSVISFDYVRTFSCFILASHLKITEHIYFHSEGSIFSSMLVLYAH